MASLFCFFRFVYKLHCLKYSENLFPIVLQTFHLTSSGELGEFVEEELVISCPLHDQDDEDVHYEYRDDDVDGNNSSVDDGGGDEVSVGT